MQLLQRMAAPQYTCVTTGVLLIIGTPDGSMDPRAFLINGRSKFM